MNKALYTDAGLLIAQSLNEFARQLLSRQGVGESSFRQQRRHALGLGHPICTRHGGAQTGLPGDRMYEFVEGLRRSFWKSACFRHDMLPVIMDAHTCGATSALPRRAFFARNRAALATVIWQKMTGCASRNLALGNSRAAKSLSHCKHGTALAPGALYNQMFVS